jgi:hypothetical protein
VVLEAGTTAPLTFFQPLALLTPVVAVVEVLTTAPQTERVETVLTVSSPFTSSQELETYR